MGLLNHYYLVRLELRSQMSAFEGAIEWAPPAKIEELFAKAAGNQFSNINAPTAGARGDPKPLPVGNAPFQLYSLFTPNGQKVSILLEELGIDYDAHSKIC